jgi:hypothetical protein
LNVDEYALPPQDIYAFRQHYFKSVDKPDRDTTVDKPARDTTVDKPARDTTVDKPARDITVDADNMNIVLTDRRKQKCIFVPIAEPTRRQSILLDNYIFFSNDASMSDKQLLPGCMMLMTYHSFQQICRQVANPEKLKNGSQPYYSFQSKDAFFKDNEIKKWCFVTTFPLELLDLNIWTRDIREYSLPDSICNLTSDRWNKNKRVSHDKVVKIRSYVDSQYLHILKSPTIALPVINWEYFVEIPTKQKDRVKLWDMFAALKNLHIEAFSCSSCDVIVFYKYNDELMTCEVLSTLLKLHAVVEVLRNATIYTEQFQRWKASWMKHYPISQAAAQTVAATAAQAAAQVAAAAQADAAQAAAQTTRVVVTTYSLEGTKNSSNALIREYLKKRSSDIYCFQAMIPSMKNIVGTMTAMKNSAAISWNESAFDVTRRDFMKQHICVCTLRHKKSKQDYCVSSIHLPEKQWNDMKYLVEFLKRVKADIFIIAGDFNFDTNIHAYLTKNSFTCLTSESASSGHIYIKSYVETMQDSLITNPMEASEQVAVTIGLNVT